MSIESWKAEFYPEPADEVPEPLALAHSLRKWEGLREANLVRHGLSRDRKDLLDACTIRLLKRAIKAQGK